jgi:uncharacterized RDD family membrane protein YckC
MKTAKDARKTTSRIHNVKTPEGVLLPFDVSTAGDRIIAFLLDNTLQVCLIFLVGYSSIRFGAQSGLLNFLTMILIFVLWNLCTSFFELRWQGQTPGKRMRRLRVIDRHGGVLSSDAVIVRNLMRQVELFIPLAVLLAPQQYFGSAPGWLTTVSTLWLMGFFFFPLFHPKHLRVGDLVGGTIVVHTPKVELAETLGAIRTGVSPGLEITFDAAQLESYGEYELQVLEDVLRRYDDGLTVDDAIGCVADQIQAKINWQWPAGIAPNDITFLRRFYQMQRERLEHRMLLGNRRKNKGDD